MDPVDQAIPIGNVLRADIRGFVVASRIPEPDVPTFGTFVRAPIQEGRAQLIGLVYDIRLQDDPFLRHLAATLNEDNPHHQEIIADQRERVIPVEIGVTAVGYRSAENVYRYGLPPQPPMILKQIIVCRPQEVKEMTVRPDWLHPLLENPDVPVDALIARTLERSARLYGERGSEAHERYLLAASRYLARFLAREPLRLETILRQLGVEE
ncbi:MAG: hypothetical protein ACP5HM_00390 [Anaerolineae bacterium]